MLLKNESTNKKEKKEMILNTLKTTMVATTPQLEVFFSDYGSPLKRCSEYLKELEKDGWVEGQKRRLMGHPKAWRLTKNARDYFGLKKRPIPFSSPKLVHQLKITECFLKLYQTGKMKAFKCELRQHFKTKNEEKVFSPDGFFVYDGRSYLLEVQHSVISSGGWRKKWEINEQFFKSQTLSIPDIIVITKQNPKVVKAKSDLPLRIMKDIDELIYGEDKKRA